MSFDLPEKEEDVLKYFQSFGIIPETKLCRLEH
jgi:hypothetical protein